MKKELHKKELNKISGGVATKAKKKHAPNVKRERKIVKATNKFIKKPTIKNPACRAK